MVSELDIQCLILGFVVFYYPFKILTKVPHMLKEAVGKKIC
jgi:hypothetical protein